MRRGRRGIPVAYGDQFTAAVGAGRFRIDVLHTPRSGQQVGGIPLQACHSYTMNCPSQLGIKGKVAWASPTSLREADQWHSRSTREAACQD